MNRSLERAVDLASSFEVVPVRWEHFSEQLLDVDIVISSTSAPAYVLRRGDLAAAMHGRHQRPLCVVDLGVPRNVDPAAGSLENVYLFDVDDLQGVVDRSHQDRLHTVTQSQAIIDQKVARFLSWWRQEMDRCVPSLSGLAEAP